MLALKNSIIDFMKSSGILKHYRRGFATNSSSSHSFVYLKDVPERVNDQKINETRFGSNDFKLDSIKEKVFYWAASRLYFNSWSEDEELQIKEAEESYRKNGDQVPELDESDFLLGIAESSVSMDEDNLITLDQARDPHLVVLGGHDATISEYRRELIVNNEVDWSRTDVEGQDFERSYLHPWREYDEEKQFESQFYRLRYGAQVKVRDSSRDFRINVFYIHRDRTHVQLKDFDTEEIVMIPIEDIDFNGAIHKSQY